MEEKFKSKLGFSLFFIIVLVLSVGGYFATQYLINSDSNDKVNKDEKVTSVKIDNSKDYIYYINDKEVSSSAEIDYKDVVINIKGQETLTEQLENENKNYDSTIKYINDENILSDEMIKYNNDNIYSLTFRRYTNYEYSNYVSLFVSDYNYSCFDSVTFNKVKSYIFDTKSGKLLSEEEILKKYSLSLDGVKEMIREKLVSEQKVVDDVELIKVDDTISEFNNYAFYIDNYGKLNISFLVKTSQVDYNDIMEVK